MRIRRIIFIVLGWICILINVAGWLAVIAVPNNKYEPHDIPEIIGFNFWFALGFAMLVSANRIKRKINRLKEQQALDSFLVEK